MLLFSASQIKTKRACTRKWALEKLAGLRGPETASQWLGKQVDDHNLQPYLRDGKPIDKSTLAGKIAASGLDWLPQPKWRGLEVQKHFVIRSPSSRPVAEGGVGIEFGYQGYLDLWLPFGGQPGFFDEKPVVGDFKTTKSIRKWALNEDALRKDVQAQLYAVWAILETKQKEINLSWLYLQTEGTHIALPTQVTVHTDEVAHQFQGIEKDAKEMLEVHRAMPKGADPKEYALSIEGNKDACGDYGGCPFQHLCFKLEDLIDEPKVNAADAAKECGMTAANGTIDLFAKLKKKAQPDVAANSAPAADAAPPATEAAPPTPPAPPTQEQIAKEPALGVNPPMPEGTPLAPPVGTVEAKPAKGKRGRPAGSKNKPAEAAADPDVVTSAPPVTHQATFEIKHPEFDEAGFDTAWNELGAAVKKFLKAVA